MFETSYKLQSLKRDKNKAKDSKRSAKRAENIGESIKREKRNISNRIEDSIYVSNIGNVSRKVNRINSGTKEALESKMSNYSRLIDEIDRKIREERKRLNEVDKE